MERHEFWIGKEFWCGGRQYRCTDIGTRVVAGIRIDSVAITTVTDGTSVSSDLSRGQAERDGWFDGPPFAVAEQLFDENDQEACSLTSPDPADADEPAL